MRSMTGFGRARAERGDLQVQAEVRSLNQRFLEIKLNLPRGWSDQETEFRKLIGTTASRGRIEAVIRSAGPRAGARLIVNEKLARSYVDELRGLKKRLALGGEPGLDALLSRPEIFQIVDQEPNIGPELALGRKALAAALKALDAERVREGKSLKRDLASRLAKIVAFTKEIGHLAEQSRQAIIAGFQSRVRELLQRPGSDDLRLVEEKRLYEDAAIAAQRADISEELARLKAHLQALGELFSRAGAVGKEIEFWLQEVGREVNTVGSKSQNPALSRLTVAIKGELEKMREQVQNVE
ncbi:MAG TPA: YicC/YloC family endoribonuclease [Candidatus Binataceae bacterium]